MLESVVAPTLCPARRSTRARRALLRVALAAVLANSTWFSATAVIPALRVDWRLDSAGAAWLVVAVQLGFIAGSVTIALLNLSDRLEPRRLIAASSMALRSSVACFGSSVKRAGEPEPSCGCPPPQPSHKSAWRSQGRVSKTLRP